MVRRRGAWRRELPGRLPGLTLAIASGALLGYLLAADDFYVFEPRVEGNQVIPTEQILGISQIQGYHIFFIDPQKVALAVAALPDVAQVQVSYRLPHHLTIRVQEREGILTWQVGDQRFAVDAAGTLLSPRQETTLPVTIQDRDAATAGGLKPGQRVAERAEAVAAARTYAGLLGQVDTFEYAQAEGLSTRVDGHRVILGDAQAAEAKITLLRTLLERLAEKGIVGAQIDVRYQTPYYRLGVEDA